MGITSLQGSHPLNKRWVAIDFQSRGVADTARIIVRLRNFHDEIGIDRDSCL
jgi:hypothetical protein